MQFKDYYRIMEVERTATQAEIKRAYRKLARKYHPDVSQAADAEARFKEVNEAYEVLKDPEKRAAYDRLGANWRTGQDFTPPPGWDAGFEFSGGGFTDGDAAGFSEFFEAMFGRGSPFGGPRAGGFHGATRGEDHHARLIISLDEAYHGSTRNVQLQVPTLDAKGHVTTRTHALNVKIPAGVTNGQKIRLAGQGASGPGGRRGDLYLEIALESHPLYEVEGRDITLILPLAPWEAALGATVDVPTLGGKVGMKIPPGSQSGRRLRLKGRGLPGQPPGDMYLQLRIVVPEARDADARALYQRMRETLDFNPRAALGV